jgi:hypothetical protein
MATTSQTRAGADAAFASWQQALYETLRRHEVTQFYSSPSPVTTVTRRLGWARARPSRVGRGRHAKAAGREHDNLTDAEFVRAHGSCPCRLG